MDRPKAEFSFFLARIIHEDWVSEILFCATNMLTRQCLRHIGRLSLDRFYRDRAFVVSRDFFQAGDVGFRPAARHFRWWCRAVEGRRASLRIDRSYVWLFR